ncbi:hypothetical protein COOONC_20928 [Cooperia oncophora]
MLFYVFLALMLLNAITEGYKGCVDRADQYLCEVIKKAGWCQSIEAEQVSAASLYCHNTCGFCDWTN